MIDEKIVTAVEPGTQRWEDLAATCEEIIGEKNWVLGDAALEVAPSRGAGRPIDTQVSINLQRFADRIGVNYNSLLSYRRVADTWTKAERYAPDVTPWKVHQQLASRKDLIRAGMTVSEAAVAMGQRNDGRTGPQSTPEARGTQTDRNLGDRAVRQAMLDSLERRARDAGGRIPTTEEIAARRETRNAVFENLVGDVQDESTRLDAPLRAIENAVAAFTEMVGSETVWAQRLRAASLAILDKIA